jgi:anti-sigma B factor antagonist
VGVVDEHSVVMSTADDDGARLLLAGPLDEPALDRLRALLDDVAVPRAVVRVELARAGTLPLGALRALAAAHRRITAGGGTFVLLDPSPAAARSLRTSGLDRALAVQGWPAPALPEPEQAETAAS